MNINRINPLDAINQATNNGKIQQAGKASRTESITVSAEAREAAELQNIRDMVLASPDVRADRVAEVKAKLADPNYLNEKLINDTADKIIEFYRL
ncbi:MAG: flagellar biosynthesis anti-sigma factor FlgM [Spirochaetaceae bacterium]|nr:flagellar biosynthesis anti-sigma factor FlgM [Spirochaetaceae bacterium]